MKFKLNIYYQNTYNNILIILHNLDFDLSSYQNLSLVEELFNFKNESIAQKFIKKFNEESSFNRIILKIYTDTSNKVLDLPKEMKTDMNNDDFVNFIKDTLLSFYFANIDEYPQTECLIYKSSKYGTKVRKIKEDARKIKGLEYFYILKQAFHQSLTSFPYTREHNQDVQKIKIGITNDLNSRLYDYITHSPVDVEIVAFYPIPILPSVTAEDIEEFLKNRLSNFWVYQEWFFLREGDLRKIIEKLIYQDLRFPKFRVIGYVDRFGDRFCVHKIPTVNTKHKEHVYIMYCNNEVALVKDPNGAFSKDNILKSLKKYTQYKDKRKKFEEIWIFIMEYMRSI